MNKRCRKCISGAALLFALALLPAHAATYRIDPKDTTANFEVSFLGVFPIRGEFRRTTGTLVYDAASRQGSIEVFIDATTLEASTSRAQASARGPDFFEVDKYPSIDFKSSRFVFDDVRLRAVEGSLTLVGKTRPVVLNVIESACVAAVKQEPAYCRASAELMVKRSAFGMKAWSHTVGEEVTIRIVIMARQMAEGESSKAEPPKETPKESPKDLAKEMPKEIPKEPVKEPSPKNEPRPDAPPVEHTSGSESFKPR